MAARVKITDKEIIDALLKNKNHKNNTAKALGISKQALHVRLKKILTTGKPTYDTLTIQQRSFADLVAQGKRPAEAVKEVYDMNSQEAADTLASKMMHQPAIQKSIKEILEEQGMTKEACAGVLKKLIFKGKDESTQLRALDQRWKLGDDYPAEKKVNVNINLDWFPVDLDKYRLTKDNEGKVIEGAIEEDKEGN